MLHRWSGPAALAVSMLALVLSLGGTSDARSSGHAKKPARHARKPDLKPSTRPHVLGLLLLDRKKHFPSSVLPLVSHAKLADNARKLGGRAASAYVASCGGDQIDLGSWCLDSSTFPLTAADIGKNDYFFATRTCVDQGGYLPTAAQLIGAASHAKLNSTLDDSQVTASIDLDPSDGLQDKYEMSGTLVTTAAGSDAAGSEGVTSGSTGNPATGQPNPVPVPANPEPETLQYVTVYDNHDHGGFAGSRPVSAPAAFRCAYDKQQNQSASGLD
jgi:hypothetical protein